MVHYGAQVAEELAQQGIEVELLDLRSLVPLDEEAILRTVCKTNRLVVCHEDTKTGGFGAEIAARVAELGFEHLDAPIRRVAALDTPVPYAPRLEDAFMPRPPDIRRALEETVEY
ncbi:MAG: transketolase C-terminal domain-containing protein [Planctomycetota bacterium]